MASPRETQNQNRVFSAYRTCAFLVFNTLLALLLLNISIALFEVFRDLLHAGSSPSAGPLFSAEGAPVDNGQRMPYHLDWFDFRACAEVGQQLAGEVLDDFYQIAQRGFVYQPWVQFSEPPWRGKRVQVVEDPTGLPLRRTIQPARREAGPVKLVFAFGGSTTFGYHVADEHTWPSYLSLELNNAVDARGGKGNVEVRNYGRGLYYPSQEVVLFAELLRRGERPSLAIFLDGVNLGPEDGSPQFTRQCADAFARAQGLLPNDRSSAWDWLPMMRWVRRTRPSAPGFAANTDTRSLPIDPEKRAKSVAERFRQNWRMAMALGKQYGVDVLVVLQPDAIYNYPLDLYRVPFPEKYQESRGVRKLLHELLTTSPVDGMVDFSNLFDEYGKNRLAVLDDCHYTPEFNRFLAKRIAEHIPKETFTTPSANP